MMIERRLYDESFLRNWTNAAFLVRQDTGQFLREHMVLPNATTNRYLVWDNERNSPVPIDGDQLTPPELANRMRLRGSVTVNLVDNQGNAIQIECTPCFELLAREAAQYDAARVKNITGVDPGKLAATAELIQGGRRVAYYGWTGIGQHTNATQMQRAVSSLYALTGSFDRIGGNRVRRGPFYQGVNAWGRLLKIRWRERSAFRSGRLARLRWVGSLLGTCIVRLRRKRPTRFVGWWRSAQIARFPMRTQN
jgi:anaerobic selenocysteine-containing dehydrogenase